MQLKPLRIVLLGATGTVGQATLAALLEQGHEVTCFVRAGAVNKEDRPACFNSAHFVGARFRHVDVTSPYSLKEQGFRGESFDAIVSCLASRTGSAEDAWAIDYAAHAEILKLAQMAGVRHMVLLSAICVQKPKLAFQHAKLAFEKELIASGMTYSIVRPTALFKSLSGQIQRLRNGKAFLVFGDGTLTTCKPIADRDLANYMTRCLTDKDLQNRILPIGGPEPAITPREQGKMLFALLDQKPRFVRVPVRMLDVIIAVLSLIGRFSRSFSSKAEFARIGRYYATESMLCLDPATGKYSAEATPSTGSEHISQFYARQIKTGHKIDLAEHAVF